MNSRLHANAIIRTVRRLITLEDQKVEEEQLDPSGSENKDVPAEEYGDGEPGEVTAQNTTTAKQLNCSIRQTNPCVLIAVHAPMMVGPTASSQAVR